MDTPWAGDACSLVDEFRAGRRSPVEELDATLAAIEASELNAWSYLDPDGARAPRPRVPTCSLPFGGVPIGVKQLTSVAGWPATEASLPLKDHVAEHDATMVARLRAAGAVLPGATTASEFGGVNLTSTKLHGATRNPWDLEQHAGRLVGRLGRGGRRRRVHDRDRRRRRRIDPDPGRLHRAGRAEEHLRADPEGPAHDRRFAHRGVGLPRAVGARRRALPRRVQRLRRARSLQPAARRGLRARPRHRTS